MLFWRKGNLIFRDFPSFREHEHFGMSRDMKWDNLSIVVNGREYTEKDIMQSKSHRNVADPLAKEIFRFYVDWHGKAESFAIQTSGSTGKPKTIRLTRNQMEYSARQTIRFFNLNRNDRLLLCLNPKFIGGRMILTRAIVGHMNVTAIDPSSNPFVKLEKTEIFDFAAFSPHQLFCILTQSSEKLEILEGMKGIIIGGAPVGPSLKKMAAQLQVPVYSTYGMTETASHVALQCINGLNPSLTFKGIGDVEFGSDKRGCLTVKGTVTDHKLLITNDLAELVSNREFMWIGRIDHVINSGGIKIRIEELEEKIGSILTEQGIICRFFVFPLPDDMLGQKTCMAFESAEPIEDKIMNALAVSLNKYEKPKMIFRVEKFAETASGKIDRKTSLQLLEQANFKT